MKITLKGFLLFSSIFFLWACADEGDVEEKSQETMTGSPDVAIRESASNIVTLDSSLSTPAGSLAIRITGENLPTDGLTATILGEGNDCGEYKLSHETAFEQSSTEVQLDAPLECLFTIITEATQIEFSQTLNSVTVIVLENQGGGNFMPLTFGTIGTP